MVHSLAEKLELQDDRMMMKITKVLELELKLDMENLMLLKIVLVMR
jgi:hypothetical protein